MSYWTLLGTCISLYVLLNFVVLPSLKRRWIATRSLTKISKAGLLAGLVTLRNMALIASVVYTAFALLVFTLSLIDGDARFLVWVVDRASTLHERLNLLKELLKTWFFVLPAGLLVCLAWRRMRQEMRHRFAERVLEEMDRLNQERAANPSAWTTEPPSEDMRALDEEIANLHARLAKAVASTADRDARARTARRIASLRARRAAIDYERRVNLDPLHEALEGAPAAGWRRWHALFLTRGFFADASWLTKVLSRATFATLTIALVSLGAEAGLVDEIGRRIVSIDQLRVENSKQDGPRPLPPDRPQDPPLANDDATAVQHLAQEFGRALVNNQHWRALRPQLTLAREVEQHLARRAILNKTTLPAADGTQTRQAVQDVANLSPVEREIVEDLAPSAARGRSRLGDEIAEHRGRGIVDWFGSRWNQTRQSILDHAALYSQPLHPDDLQGPLVDRILSSIVDESLPDGGGEIGRQARSALTAATKTAINDGIDMQLRVMLADLDAGSSIDEALSHVRTRPIAVGMQHVDNVALLLQQSRASVDEISRKIAPEQTIWRSRSDAPGPPSTPASSTPASSATDVVEDIVRAATQGGKVSLSENDIEALAEYDDHFPRTAAGQTRTAFGRTMERHLLAADRPVFERLAVVKAARARSFTMLRGFSRIGGVLIGAAADNPRADLNLRDISWTVQENRVSLSLRTGDGKSVDAGSYDRGIVHQALAYAADGRPVAVTMTTARPLSQLKIHLHPALVDTPLGCHVIELDRLVDTYAGKRLPGRRELTLAYIQQEQLYRFAWGSRLNSFAPVNDNSFFRAEGERLVEEGQHDPSVQAALADFEATDGPNSTFRRKPEFFDPDLLEVMRGCAGNRQAIAFGRCIEGRFADRFDELRSDAVRNRWLTQPASFNPWSGVRERPFAVTGNFEFLRDQRGSNPLLHPFRFMVQLAFTSPAVAAPNPADYVDEHPLEFEQLEGEIQKLVAAGAARDNLAPMFAELRSFTLLQRLFRVLLQGQGGPRFQVRKLAALEDATAGGVPYVHTRRWNGSMTTFFDTRLRQMLAAPAARSEAAWTQTARASGRRCLPLLGNAGASGLRDAQWNRDCDFRQVVEPAMRACRASGDVDGTDPACTWAQLAGMAPDMPQIHRYEQAFGVLDDEAVAARFSCAAPTARAS